MMNEQEATAYEEAQFEIQKLQERLKVLRQIPNPKLGKELVAKYVDQAIRDAEMDGNVHLVEQLEAVRAGL